MRQIMALFFVLGLAACGGEPEAPAATETGTVAAPGSSTPDETITDPAIRNGEIPARFIGVWDYVGGTCSPDSDMRMEIAPRTITFYESVGAVAGVGQDGEDAIADLAMEGEGEKWVNSLRLSLVEVDGETQLHTSDATKPKVADEFPRKKCPS